MTTLSLGRLAPERWRIRGLEEQSEAREAALRFLQRRPEVVAVDCRASGVLEISLTANADESRLALALEERLAVLEQAHATRGRAAAAQVELAHETHGRARLRLPPGYEDEAGRLAHWLSSQAGVLKVAHSQAGGSVRVVFDPRLTSSGALAYLVQRSDPLRWGEPERPAERQQTSRLSTAAHLALLAACTAELLPVPLLTLGVAAASVPTLRRTLKALRQRRATVDLMDTVAIGISAATGQLGTAAAITSLLHLGDLLLERAARTARAALSTLVDLGPTEAFREGDGGVVERVPADQLRVGDRVVVATGRRVPADGVIELGSGQVDEKALTGESMPRACHPGDRVLAASVVVEGELRLRVMKVGKDTTAAQIVRLLEEAGEKPMTLQHHVEKVADRLVLPTFALAGAAFALTGQLDRMTSVLITDFGTGIRVATPTAALAAMTVAVRKGVLVKGAQFLERMAKADVVVFDKTGTLTHGELAVSGVRALRGHSPDKVLAWAAGAESSAAHPIAEAIRQHALSRSLAIPVSEPGSVQVSVGRGLAARVDGRLVLVGSARFMLGHQIDLGPGLALADAHHAEGFATQYVAADGHLVGLLGTRDEARPESLEIVRRLQAQGRQVVLLSGDAQPVVQAIARELGIDQAFGGLLPEDKAARVQALQAQGHTVAMVGDGINDAPALALADVGLSLKGSTDLALETADVVLLEGSLEKLPDAFLVAEEAMATVKRGLGLVLVPNAVAIALGAAGLLSPGLAALTNNGSTVVATLSALWPILRTPRSK